jgi:hypothetical protein
MPFGPGCTQIGIEYTAAPDGETPGDPAVRPMSATAAAENVNAAIAAMPERMLPE